MIIFRWALVLLAAAFLLLIVSCAHPPLACYPAQDSHGQQLIVCMPVDQDQIGPAPPAPQRPKRHDPA